MSRKMSLLQKMITVLTAIAFLAVISVLTVSAAPDPGADGGNQSAEEGVITNEPVDPGAGETPQGGDTDPGVDDGGSGSGNVTPDDGSGSYDVYEQPTVYSNEDIREQFREQYDRYINGLEDIGDNISQYTPNENLDNLPLVAAGDVIEATAEPLPDVAVSDATLFSGSVMWLCVAVGISVVAGVMVSKRTHRRGV